MDLCVQFTSVYTLNGLNRSGHCEVDEIEAKQYDSSTHTHTPAIH
jgi:hypothetical protein